MPASTAERVIGNTSARSRARIERETERRLDGLRGKPDRIRERLRELDEEWDIERALATGSSSLSLLGLGLTILRGKGWLALPLAVQGFYLQHALQGWCPPLPLFRALGFRTPAEVGEERCALEGMLREEGAG